MNKKILIGISLLIIIIAMIFFSSQNKPPLAGKKGLDTLARQGIVKKARQEDLDKYFISKEKCLHQKHSRRKVDEKTYVVLKPMNYPLGLIGGNAPTLIISRGIPKPTGDPGQSEILDMNFTCAELIQERKKMQEATFEKFSPELREKLEKTTYPEMHR